MVASDSEGSSVGYLPNTIYTLVGAVMVWETPPKIMVVGTGFFQVLKGGKDALLERNAFVKLCD
jgi:hypothetical protein